MSHGTDTPAAEAANPSTDPARLAALAQSNPELRATIAANPACYPGLLDWIDSVGDSAAKAAVAARRAGAATPAPADPFARPAQPFVAAPTVTTAVGDAPRRSRAPLFVGLAAGLVILLVGGGIAYSLLFSKFGGATSPEAAVSKALDAFKNLDSVALYGAMSPAELNMFTAALDELQGTSLGDGDAEQEDLASLVNELRAVTEVRIENLEFDVDEVADGVAKVTVTDGDFFMDSDPEVLARLTSLYEVALHRSNPWGYSDDTIEEGVENTIEYHEDRLEDQLPYKFDADDVEDSLGFQFTLMAVNEGGAWYVSPVLSMLELYREQFNRYVDWDLGDLPKEQDIAQFGTSEEAMAGLLDAVESLDVDDVIAALPLVERRALALYGADYFEDLGRGDFDLSFDDLELAVENRGSTALLQIESLTIDWQNGYDAATIEVEGVCAEWDRKGYSSGDGCLDDVKALDLLGVEDIRLVAVNENGRWFVSPLQTMGFISSIFAKKYAELAADGDLDKLGK